MGTNNSRCTTTEYIAELNKVLASHTQLGVHFVLNLALYLEGPHDISDVIQVLNKQSYSVHYFVLVHNYKDDRKITGEMQAELQRMIGRGSMHTVDMLVKNSSIRMEQRSAEVTEIIGDILNKSVFYPL
ncbi:hypothetical protein [Chitinophaga sp. Cy-1792]|uniref:hypothetical protein n=1 Tax=Chitinophaga sp. Cy-1792 TaxID=2608339 RepID=UPI00141EC370|nr:hypothetical protein [Chitinophaga sp. Cy-1792]NIG52400.1 hypothetical protein [Chitinophaga sp. Cy-1792]